MGELQTPNKYICFEGVDGCGKTTVVTKLLERLEGKAYAVRFPSDGPVGRVIRSFLAGERHLSNVKAMLYLFAADGFMEDPALRRALKERHLVCDRHPILSGRVFQLEHHERFHVNAVYNTVELLRPDFLFVIDVPPEVTIERCSGRNKYQDVVYESENLDYLKRLRTRYMELMNAARSRGWAKESVGLDGRFTPDELVDQVVQIAGLG
jgi:dTMP kinase